MPEANMFTVPTAAGYRLQRLIRIRRKTYYRGCIEALDKLTEYIERPNLTLL